MAERHWSDHKPWDKWTDKERLFAHEYLIDQSMTKAAIRAGYSEKSAVKIAHQLYHKPHINGWIEEQLAKRCSKLNITAERILQELALIGFANIAGAFNKDNSLKAIVDMPEDIQRVISGIDTDELFEGRGEERELIGHTKKLRTWDKLKALELMGKNLKMWIDRVETDDSPRNTVIIRDLTGKKKKGAD